MKFFTREVKIALTAIAAIAALYLLINFMKGVNVFKSSNTYYVEFADIQGLAVSNSVYANGYPVGIVRTISYDYDSKERVVVGVELDKEMRVPEGTTAELESSLMGGVSMHLLLGPNPSRTLPKGATIQGGLHEGALSKVEALLPTVADMVPKADSIMGNVNILTGDPALKAILVNFATASRNFSETSARLNTLMQQDIPQMMNKMQTVSNNLERLSGNLAEADVKQAMDGVNTALGEVQQFSKNMNTLSTELNAKLNGRDNSLGLLMNDRSLYDDLNATVGSLNRAVGSGDSLLTDFKAHPKRYIHFSVFGKKDK